MWIKNILMFALVMKDKWQLVSSVAYIEVFYNVLTELLVRLNHDVESNLYNFWSLSTSQLSNKFHMFIVVAFNNTVIPLWVQI